MRRKTLLRVASTLPAPPPSPILTARDSRSAANSFFSDSTDKTSEFPQFDLPEQLFRFVPADIEYQALKSGDTLAANRILKSAMKFGSFRISGHGISTEELRSTVREAESVLGVSPECWRNNSDRQEFIWSRSGEATSERLKQVVGAKNDRNLNQKMESIAYKLEAIAEELYQIISGNGSDQSRTNIQLNNSKLSLYKHKNFTLDDESENSSEEISQNDSCKYALSLHLAVEKGEFCLESEQGILSLDTDANTIIVTIKEHLEEWSHGEFKSSQGKLYFEPDHASKTSFSFELRYLPPNLYPDINKTKKRISVLDQILAVLFLFVIYKLFVLYICS